MGKALSEFQTLTRKSIYFSSGVIIFGLVTGLLFLSILAADHSSIGMGALVGVMLVQLAALIVLVLGLVAVILGLTAVSKESDKKGRAICRILYIVCLSLVGCIVLFFSGLI